MFGSCLRNKIVNRAQHHFDHNRLFEATVCTFEEAVGLVRNLRNKSSWCYAIDIQRALLLDDNDTTVVNAKGKLFRAVPRSMKSKP
jgi:hypothetical protein